MNRFYSSIILAALAAFGAEAGVNGPCARIPASQRSVGILDSQAIGTPARKAPAKAAEGQTLVLSEDFSKCTAGTEAAPDSNGIVGEIPASLTQKSGWVGATFRQAGGCAFLDTYSINYQGQDMDVFYIDTPILGLPSGQSLVEVKFRARSAALSGDICYIINGDGRDGTTLSMAQLNITGEWAEYTAYINGCNAYSFLEIQGDSHPFYIDDIKVSTFTDLDTPKVLPATDITAAGFTANWETVANATGYIVSPKSIHVSNGMDPRYLIDADFESITNGTIENPALPQYSVYSLDDFIPQKGWLVRLPYFAKGCLGLSNELMSTYGNSLLQSPTLNLSGNEGKVNVKMRYLVQDVDMFQVCLYSVLADGRVSLRATKMVYTGEQFNKWKDEEFTISGGTVSSMLVVILPETTKGTLFFDNLQMWQMLDNGVRYTEPMTSVNASTNSARVATPDASENVSYSYSVTAYRQLPTGSYIYSDPSGEIVVGSDSAEEPASLDAPAPTTVNVEGGRFTAEWAAVPGANSYKVNLYRRHVSNGLESNDVINENFDGIKVGTTDLDRPRAMSEDGYDRLDAFTKQPGWEVFQGFYVDGAVGILGYWNMLGVGCYMRSPEFDLSANGGKMTMNVKVGSDYYNQGATIYLCHENKETGALVYDEIFPMDEMEKGFHDFTVQFTKGREDSFFVFYPYGYGLSYFDDIRVSQSLPAGESVIKVSSATATGTTATLTVPDFVEGDEYFYTVTAQWIDSNDVLKVESEASAEIPLEGIVKTTVFTGKVTDHEGNGVAGATVRLVNNASPDKIMSVKTNRWGLFRLDNVGDFESSFTPLASAAGYLTGMAPTVKFENGAAVEDVELKLRPSASETEKEIGIPTRFASTGAVYLQFNNSESETLYTADLLDLPSNAVITAISYDGYCDKSKAVDYRMELYLQNTEDETVGSGATPKEDMELFASETKNIAMGGTSSLPVELVRFENAGGFKYAGGNLRVLASSRSNKTNSIYFLMDATRPATSVYRYWGSSESNTWKVNTAGMPMMRLEYGLDLSGAPGCISTEMIHGVKAIGMDGAIRFEADAACAVKVYSPSGLCVGAVALEAGTTTVTGFAPGIYIIEGSKVAVK